MQIREETYIDGHGRSVRVRFTVDPKKWEEALRHLTNQAIGRGGKSTAFQGAIVAEVIERTPPAAPTEIKE